jgi:hypothetical protein
MFSNSIYSTHIVGGDFKITMTNNGATSSSYDIQLRLYRDNVNGLVQLPTTVTVGIYKIGTNILQTSKTLYLNNGTGSILPLGDPCYTPNPNDVQIEEGVYKNLTGQTVSLPNYSFGYYIQYQTCCRNGIIDNLMTPTSDGISIIAIIPDPGIGQNSSPDFGNYPLDAYFCVNNVKNFTWPVTDPDGDSLVYSLVAPLDQGSGIGTGNSGPGTNPYPFYPDCIFSGLYNTSNMIGGTPPMSINPVSGEMTASPAIQGFFAFAVRVEEYRNGTKIGEVRRDAQYASLPCVIANPPVVSVNNSQGNSQNDSIFIDAYVNDSICFDLELGVNDPNDSIYILLNSNDIDLTASFIAPDTMSPGSSLAYGNWSNIITDSVFFNAPVQVSSGHYGSLGNIFRRYCWLPPCEAVDSTFIVSMDSYSVDCSGFNQKLSNLYINVSSPAPNTLEIPSNITLTVSDTLCLDLFAEDTLNELDTLSIVPSSSTFDFTSTLVEPDFNSGSNEYSYDDFNDSTGNTIFMDEFTSSNGIFSAIGRVGLRFCWVVDCDAAAIENFEINYKAYSTVCGSDTIFDTSMITIFNEPEPINLDVPSNISLKLDSISCIDLYALDNNIISNPNYDDTLFLQPLSSLGFDFESSYVSPETNNGSSFYMDFTYIDSLGDVQLIDTLFMNNHFHANNISSAIGEVGLRFCWVVDCDYVFQKEFDLFYMAYSTVCASDTTYDSSHVEIEPPVAEPQPIPNVFTPGNGGENEFFQLTPSNEFTKEDGDPIIKYDDPCFDEMEVFIYNRWGQKVFETSDPKFKWDGTKNGDGSTICKSGLYLVIVNGTYGSAYDSLSGERIANPVKDEYWIQLFRE